jgi:hypothetical protein
MLRARWVTLRARWVTLRARWVTLRARWVTLRARWVTQLPYAQLRELLDGAGEPAVQVQALNLVRNLVHGQAEDVAAVLEYSGGDVLRVVGRALAARCGSLSLSLSLSLSSCCQQPI